MPHTEPVSQKDADVHDEVADPERAALDLIVNMVMGAVGRTATQFGAAWEPMRLESALQEFTSMLEVDGAFRGDDMARRQGCGGDDCC